MKTQIIQLEIHDDTLSVRDKMDWSQTPRVLLVWPESGKVLQNRLDLILLERYCSANGSQLALLTADPEVIFQAGEAGIPVFQTRPAAQLQPWGKSFREFQRQDLQRYKAENPPPDSLRRDPLPVRNKLPLWARIPIFTAGVLAVLAIAATLLPTAEIIIQEESLQHELLVPIQADPGGEEIGISGTVPGRELAVVVRAQLSRSTTGITAIPSEYAQGSIQFTNLGRESIQIPEDTILSTGGESPVLFRTLHDAKTPPGTGEQITVEIEALYPGPKGNVAENQIQQINLSAGAELLVTNPDPTRGGEDLELPAPDQLDQALLSSEMNQYLNEEAHREIQNRLDSDEILLSSRLNDYQIVEESFSPALETPGDTLWLDRTIRYRVYYVSGEDLLALARELILAQYQQGINQPDLDSIQLQSVSQPALNRGQFYSWQEKITWQESPTTQPELIIRWMLGKKTAEAAGAVQKNLGLTHQPEIILQPSWWPRIPVIPFRITVNPRGTSNGQ